MDNRNEDCRVGAADLEPSPADLDALPAPEAPATALLTRRLAPLR